MSDQPLPGDSLTNEQLEAIRKRLGPREQRLRIKKEAEKLLSQCHFFVENEALRMRLPEGVYSGDEIGKFSNAIRALGIFCRDHDDQSSGLEQPGTRCCVAEDRNQGQSSGSVWRPPDIVYMFFDDAAAVICGLNIKSPILDQFALQNNIARPRGENRGRE